MVLALLGDNPMQSEFACHIGLRGKFFCRACWVKGHDAQDPSQKTGKPTAADSDDETAASNRRSAAGSDAEASSNAGSDGAETSAEGSQAGSETSSTAKKLKRGAKQAKETLGGLIQRAKNFINVCLKIPWVPQQT